MKAKEKAKELVERYLKKIIELAYAETKSKELAKQCALICVDEKIETLLPYAGLLDIKKTIDELEEVKQEINKL